MLYPLSYEGSRADQAVSRVPGHVDGQVTAT